MTLTLKLGRLVMIKLRIKTVPLPGSGFPYSRVLGDQILVCKIHSVPIIPTLQKLKSKIDLDLKSEIDLD